MKQILILGAGGHARVLIDLIREGRLFSIAGILDPVCRPRDQVSGIPVWGQDSVLSEVRAKKIGRVCIGVGGVCSNTLRRQLFVCVRNLEYEIPVLCHPKSWVARTAVLKPGCQIMAGALIQSGAVVGENVIVNTGSIVEHDCILGPHAHLCSGAVLSGASRAMEGSFIGSGAVVLPGVTIGKNAVIGAGSVVVRDVPADATVMGVPAK